MGTSTLDVGDVIAEKYELRKRLGEGGMGTVWLAHNIPLAVDVAIKVIRGDLRERAGATGVKRLLAEARATARLKHPAIVRTYDFGVTDKGDPFIVMELLEGGDLEQLLERKGKLHPERAVSVLLPIAHGLSKAHGKGIVHRDIKPENIFLAQTEDGQVQPKLIDFGVVKVAADRAAHRITAMGATVGSPSFMSPEQARGHEAKAASDIWSFSVVLYEAITGSFAFDADNFNGLMRSIIEDEVRPIRDHGVEDEELWAIICRGLEKDPDERWPSMLELGRALAEWLWERGYEHDIVGDSIATTWLEARKSMSSLDLFSDGPPSSQRFGERPSNRGRDSPAHPAGRARFSSSERLASSSSGDKRTVTSPSLAGLTSVAPPGPGAEPHRPPSRLKLWLALAGAAAVALGAVGFGMTRLGTPAESAPESEPAATAPAPSTEATATPSDMAPTEPEATETQPEEEPPEEDRPSAEPEEPEAPPPTPARPVVAPRPVPGSLPKPKPAAPAPKPAPEPPPPPKLMKPTF